MARRPPMGPWPFLRTAVCRRSGSLRGLRPGGELPSRGSVFPRCRPGGLPSSRRCARRRCRRMRARGFMLPAYTAWPVSVLCARACSGSASANAGRAALPMLLYIVPVGCCPALLWLSVQGWLVLLPDHAEPDECVEDAVVVYGCCHVVGGGLHVGACVAHGHADACAADD